VAGLILATGLAAVMPSRHLAQAAPAPTAGEWQCARDALESQIERANPHEADALRLQICATLQRQTRLAKARDCYWTARSRMATEEGSAMARYRAAMLDSELGNQAAARQGADWLLTHRPSSAAARRAVLFLRALRREEGGAAAEADFLLGVASRLRQSAERALAPEPRPDAVLDLYLECLVEAARIRLEKRGRERSAARLLERAVRAATTSDWLDDALIWLARARRAIGAHRSALESYHRLLESHEGSWLVGSYDSQFRDDAMLEIGGTLEELGRPRDALAAYARLLEDAPTSRLRDDAAWRATRLSGDPEALRAFLSEYPESRHAGEARQMLEGP
jgi:tetratricopeptide (TPR) repeat protein